MKSKGRAHQVYGGGRIRKVGDVYAVEYSAHGSRKRQRVASIGEAKTLIDQWNAGSRNHGQAFMDISPRDLADVQTARPRLGSTSLEEVFNFWFSNQRVATETKTVTELVEEFLAAPGRRGGRSLVRRDRTISNHRNRLGKFTSHFGAALGSDVRTADIETWLDAHGWEGLNRRHYIASVRACFAHAVRKGYVSRNPAEGIELTTSSSGDPVIMTSQDVGAFLLTIGEMHPQLLVREVFSFFCGLRTAEIDRLDWRNVSVENRLVTITGEVAKVSGHRRNVDLAENVVQWIEPLAQASGPIADAATYYEKRRKAAKVAGVVVPGNAGRHAFASYHLALHRNAPLTAEQLGHSDVNLLRTVYRNIVASDGRPITVESARDFFAITPSSLACGSQP